MKPTPTSAPHATLRASLLRLVLASLLPGVLGAIALLAYQYRQGHAQMESTMLTTARALVQATDTHLLTAQAVAWSLSTSDSLAEGNLSRFHAEASNAVARVGLATNVVLVDPTGRQRVNTAVDYNPSVPLPTLSESLRVQLRPVFAEGRPVILGLFMGPVLKQPLMSVEVPVQIDGRVRYSLGVAIKPVHFNSLLEKQNLPPGWVAGIRDQYGTIVGRSEAPEAFIGTRGAASVWDEVRSRAEGGGRVVMIDEKPSFLYHSTSPATGWSVILAIPRRTADAIFVQTSSLIAVGIAVLFGIGILLATRIAGQIAQTFRTLNEAAADVGAGRRISLPALEIQEAQDLAQVMRRTSDLLIERNATLRASQARFRALADNIAQLAWMADRAGQIEWFNRRWHEYAGECKDTVPAENWLECVDPAHKERVRAKLQDCIAQGVPWEDTFPLRGRDGGFRWFLSRAFPLRDPGGEIVSWFGTHTDVTDQLQAQEALQETHRRKDEFIAMLAHELRNPLAPLRTASEILRRLDRGDPRQRRAREVIERQVAHMTRLIDDLLDVSRIARGRLVLERRYCDLAALVRQTAEDYRDSVEACQLRLKIEVEPEPMWVNGDPVRLSQMIGNLLNNAMRFTEPGGDIEVCCEADEAQGMVQVRISDTGVGIPPELLARLFDPLSQAAQDLARSKGGLGLGLALTRGLAQLHGGYVTAHSEGAGRGASFVFGIPRVHPSPEAIAAPALLAPSRAPRRVVVIEDNRDAAQTMADLLRLAGHEVRLAFTGESGVAAVLAFRPDLVLSDIGLPGGMDGYAVARQLRSLPELAGLRLIALSGYADERAREGSLRAGFDAHLAKPVDLPSLEAAMAAG